VCSVDELQVGVVDASAQIVSHLIVGREGYPGQLRVTAVNGFGEEERDLLPVRLMIVDSAEGRSPVVHRVEEPVLQDEVSGVANGTHVVGGCQPSRLLVADVRRRCEAAGNFAAHDQGKSHDRIDEPTEHADHGEGAATLEPCAIRATTPAAVSRSTQGFLDKVELQVRAAAVARGADQGR
jgi:hypothetical protein